MENKLFSHKKYRQKRNRDNDTSKPRVEGSHSCKGLVEFTR